LDIDIAVNEDRQLGLIVVGSEKLVQGADPDSCHFGEIRAKEREMNIETHT
jgi:hypothetical protein